jgi:membrane protein YdbS with pleckstrin-like domain
LEEVSMAKLLANLNVFKVHRSWEQVIEFFLGLWLAISVFVLDYGIAADLRVWHFVISALVALMAAIEFWLHSAKSHRRLTIPARCA